MINYYKFVTYHGPSMNPTLKVGDQLQVVSYDKKKIRTGDVVVFKAPEGEQYVAHRVVSADVLGVITKGDNNNKKDSWVLQPEEIIGRVDSVLRGVKRIKIHAGRRGMIYASAFQRIKRANLTISRILHPTYGWLSELGIFRRALPLWAVPRVVCFFKCNGMEMQLLMGRSMIGRRRPGSDQWWIRRPFRLFVDEASLPKNISGDLVSSQHAPLQPSGH